MVKGLTAIRVLVVEDEALVALALAGTLERFGCLVVGPVGRVRRALDLIAATEVDAAVLDVNLAGDKVFPVAEELTRRGVPIVFATGYGTAGLDGAFSDAEVLQKPYPEAALAEALRNALMRRRVLG
jgi:CheY-like chemotaxis protein